MSAPAELCQQLQDMTAKSRRALASVQREIDAGDFDFASSRAYFAAFYAVEALLLSQGITCATHSGAIAEFGKHFAATGKLPKDMGRRLARLFRERQTGDYEFGISIDESEAQEDLLHARAILDAAESYLVKGQFLHDKS